MRIESAWRIAAKQHGVIARRQLLDLGLSYQAIQHRIERGRLHQVERGVYAVGRPELSRLGAWMTATLSAGPEAVLSHSSAGELWGIIAGDSRPIEVSVPARSGRRQIRIRVHRRPGLRPRDRAVREGIPVTGLVRTFTDLATQLSRAELERAINEADKLGLIDPEVLRAKLEGYRGQRGVKRLREVLDRRTFRLTDSDLERRFLALVGRAGLPLPLTGQHLNGFKTDFCWPALGLVVETDGLTYHRTPAQQARDRARDQAHTAAGLTPLRFTHAQVRFEAEQVAETLRRVISRLESNRAA